MQILALVITIISTILTCQVCRSIGLDYSQWEYWYFVIVPELCGMIYILLYNRGEE